MEYVLTVNALSKHYRHFKALHNLSMHVPKGSIYGFVGKNGAGKTTLIRLICGLQKPTSGDYTVYGIRNNSSEITASRRRMGAVIETPSIYLDMTAEENLKEQYRILGLPSYSGISDVLQLVGLSDTGKKKAKHFSLGMRQRLGIAIALAGDPDFLVLDEPINGLDPQGIIEMRELILKLNRKHQIIDRGHMVKEISAEDLEAACRKCVRVEVSNIKVLSRVLDDLKLEYHILSDVQADIYAKINITQLTLSLAKEGCEILSMHEHDETLESYYVNLVGGAKE